MTREAPTKEGSVVAPAQELNRPLSIGVQPSTSSFCVSQIIRRGRPLQRSVRGLVMARTRRRGPRRRACSDNLCGLAGLPRRSPPSSLASGAGRLAGSGSFRARGGREPFFFGGFAPPFPVRRPLSFHNSFQTLFFPEFLYNYVLSL